MTQLQPRVVDISHHNTVHDMSAVAAAGVWGIIHKSSQGNGYVDPDYAKRRQMTLDAGLLWGAYHFNDGSDVAHQVDWFLRCAQPDNTTLLVLDFEDNPKSNMSATQMVQFLRLMEQKTGRKAAIYSGNRLKENIGRLSAADRSYVCSHPLWLCQYGATPKLPPGFSSMFLWQYTDGHFGPLPHGMAGISGDVDLNTFSGGTRENLEAVWVSQTPLVLESEASSHSVLAAQDQIDDAAGDAAGDVAGNASRPADGWTTPPRLIMQSTQQAGGANVRPQTARYDVAVEVVQRELDGMGYHEVGTVDGKWGGKTAAAIKGFFTDRGVMQADGATPAVAEMGQTLNDAIDRAKAEEFTRPIAPERANATPKDIAPHVEAVRVGLWQQLCAKVATGAAALGIGGSSISNLYSSTQGTLSPVHDALSKIPPEVWMLLVGAIAGLVWYATNRTANATTKDYNTGRLS